MIDLPEHNVAFDPTKVICMRLVDNGIVAGTTTPKFQIVVRLIEGVTLELDCGMSRDPAKECFERLVAKCTKEVGL